MENLHFASDTTPPSGTVPSIAVTPYLFLTRKSTDTGSRFSNCATSVTTTQKLSRNVCASPFSATCRFSHVRYT